MTTYDPRDCPDCMAWYADQPHLTGAAASVGVSRGLSAQQVLHATLANYHSQGHPRRERGALLTPSGPPRDPSKDTHLIQEDPDEHR